MIDMCGTEYQRIYDNSPLLQYIDLKTEAVNRGCTARRNLANLYAIYSMTYYSSLENYENREEYEGSNGFAYKDIKAFANSLYGGEKIQNHGYNNRAIGEFRNKTKTEADLFTITGGKYKIQSDYLYVNEKNLSTIVNAIIEKYIFLIRTKDENTIGVIDKISQESDPEKKKESLKSLLKEDAEARLFEILSYAILKMYYSKKLIFFGIEEKSVRKSNLTLYKTGRTNANDGGIDFVLKPMGRFFQVTEVGKYDKYFLDIDKVMRFPITFVVKTNKDKNTIHTEMIGALKNKYGDTNELIETYKAAIEEIITMNELLNIIDSFSNEDVIKVTDTFTVYFNLEMNIEEDESSEDVDIADTDSGED
jgi:hypothetical protein